MQKDWWEDVWVHVKSRGGDVSPAWRDEWEGVISRAEATGANVLDIGMHWYSYGDDEACGMTGCVCGDNSKPLTYWFPTSDDGNNYYSTPPMYIC